MNKRLSIALDGMLLGGDFTGVEHSIAGLAQSLAQGGSHEYRFFVPESSPVAGLDSDCFRTERIGIPSSRISRLVWEQRKLPRLLSAGNYDLLHAPGYLSPLSTDVPVVLTVYDVQALLHPELCLLLNRLNYRIMLPRSIGKASGIIVPSESVAREVRGLFPEAGTKLRVVPLGVDADFRVLEGDERAASISGLGISGPFILFVGNMAPNKNLQTLIRAFAGMKRSGGCKHKLVLAGRQSREYGRLCRLVQKEGLEGEVIWPGHISKSTLVGLYNAADVFVFPSIYEGFGLPPLEAMACGTPVVCAGTGACAEVAGPAAAMVDPHDSEAMGEAITDLLRNTERRDALVERGRARAGEFTWERARAATEAFYAEVLSWG